MASNFHVQNPYVLKKLPAPVIQGSDPSRYWAAEVSGQQAGSKKRKRTELAVGIDHDAVNLYNIPSGHAITSYPIPPQSSLTCPPCSLRWKPAVGKDAIRYTYVATESSQLAKRSLNLFKEVVAASGSAASTTVSQSYNHAHPVVHLSIAQVPSTSSTLASEQSDHVLVAVARDGSIYCYHGETLKEAWQSSPSILLQELPTQGKLTCEVEFAHSALASDVIEGIFEGKPDAFSCFSQEIQRDGFNPHTLVLVTSVSATAKSSTTQHRYLHVLTLAHGSQTSTGRLISLLSVPIPPPVGNLSTPPSYRMDPRSGSLMALHGDTLHTYAVRGSIPKLEASLDVAGMKSFIRLSKTSVLAYRAGFLEVYNPVLRSLQTTTAADLENDAQGNPIASGTDMADVKENPCELITYFPGLEVAVGLKGSALVAIQVEPPKTRITKRRADGLLVDSLGRGINQDLHLQKRGKIEQESSALAGYLPGSLVDDYWEEWRSEAQKADQLLSSGDTRAFDKFMASKFRGETFQDKTPNTEGAGTSGDVDSLEELQSPDSDDFVQVDRRWLLYCIRKVLALEPGPDQAGFRMSCVLPDSWTFHYLAGAGGLSTSNLRSAFKDEFLDAENVELTLNEEIPRIIVQVDPTMELLVHYLQSTQLGAIELLIAIRLVMGSLGLVHDAKKVPQRLLTSGEDEQDPELAAIGMELDQAEAELQITEYYLGDESSTRARALSAAFGKLEACPAVATVQGIRRLYKPEQTLSLINILRTELIRDGWTTPYLDGRFADEDGDDASDGSLRIIADLLCRCVDSVGPTGWLANDALLANLGGQHETADFFDQLKMEVSAALEGVEEAVHLRAILAQIVKFGKGLPSPHTGKSQSSAITTLSSHEDARLLPFGLKGKSKVPHEKVISGGEVVHLSRRERGLLLSKKVGPYEVERISI